MNSDYIGKICIRLGNDNQEPSIVYVFGINTFGSLVCRVLNTGMVQFTNPESETGLVDFDIDVFQKLRKEWKLKEAQRLVEKLQKEIDEGDYY